jgi:hypothetical protein
VDNSVDKLRKSFPTPSQMGLQVKLINF